MPPLDNEFVSVSSTLRRSVVAVLSGHGAGAGTAWGDGSLVVTNHHVASRDDLRVVDADGNEQGGEVVAREPESDLAVIRVENSLPPATAADPLALRPGERVFAVGNPLGQEGAVTAGVVLARPTKDELIRADILLQPGNSGGPLATAAGRVAGINAMVSGGLGMAIPVTLVDRLVEGIGEPAGFLGISGTWVGEANGEAALLLTEVAAGSAAERAGLIPGDLVYEIAGVPVASGRRARLLAGHPTHVRIRRAHADADIEVVPATLN